MAVLKKGSKGSSVKKLQKRLSTFKAGLVLDGIFGSKTDAAVREFQKNSGLKVDGLVGKNTFAALDLKISGSKSAGKKASGGKGVSLVDWKLAEYKDRFKRIQKMYAPYPTKYKQRKKDHKVFLGDAVGFLAMDTGGGASSLKSTFYKAEKAVDTSFLAFARSSEEFIAFLTQMSQLVERYHNLKKAGQFAAAIEIGEEVNKQEKMYEPYKTQWLNLLVDFDMAHDGQVKLQKFLRKEIDKRKKE